jgi:hypothetical protein
MFAISIGYHSQPAEILPLNYNSFQGDFPTPERSSVVPILGEGSIPSAAH